MTREEAIRMIERIKDRINWEVVDSQKKMDALNMAIKSLEAWEKVKTEIGATLEHHEEFYNNNLSYRYGMEATLEIIDKHLAEVSE